MSVGTKMDCKAADAVRPADMERNYVYKMEKKTPEAVWLEKQEATKQDAQGRPQQAKGRRGSRLDLWQCAHTGLPQSHSQRGYLLHHDSGPHLQKAKR